MCIRDRLVIGSYVFVLAMGLLSLIISLIAQSLVLKVLGETVGVFDIVTAAIAGVFLFALYTAVSYTHLDVYKRQERTKRVVPREVSSADGNRVCTP